MHSLLITLISEKVEAVCKGESNKFGYDVWTHHIQNVVKFGKILSELMCADYEVVEIAALLHDYAGIKDCTMYDKHHYFGAIEAEKILRHYDYPSDKISLVMDCILSHRGSVNIKQKSKEAICLASADAMAHIDQVPSLLHLAYDRYKMNTDEGVKWVRDKIDRSWNKLCPEAKELIRNKYLSAIIILDLGTFPSN